VTALCGKLRYPKPEDVRVVFVLGERERRREINE
jgi:hypothetical protein